MITALPPLPAIKVPSNHPGIENDQDGLNDLPSDDQIAATKPDFVDVSHHQGNVDWDAYAKTGLKMGVCKITEGGRQVVSV